MLQLFAEITPQVCTKQVYLMRMDASNVCTDRFCVTNGEGPSCKERPRRCPRTVFCVMYFQCGPGFTHLRAVSNATAVKDTEIRRREGNPILQTICEKTTEEKKCDQMLCRSYR